MQTVADAHCPTVEKELMQSVKQTGFTGEICFLPKYHAMTQAKMS